METGLHYPLDIEAMPPHWNVGYVGDFAEEIQPGFASGKYNKEGAGVPHIRPFNIDRQGRLDLAEIKSVAPDADAKRLHSGDVLFNNTNSPELVGKTAAITSAGDWAFSNHMTRVRFKADVLPLFGAYQLHFLWMTGYYLHNCVKHVNQASVSSKTLARAVPFIAPPIDEQKHIVAEFEKQFSRLDEAVANLNRVKANLKRYRAAVLKAAVEGHLVETEAELARRERRGYEPGEQLLRRITENRHVRRNGKVSHQGHGLEDNRDELPTGWTWASVGQLGDVGTGATPLKSKREYYEGGTIPWVTSGALNEEFVDSADEHITELALRDTNAKLFPSHTLLVAMYGEGKTRGKVSELLIRAATNQACAAIVMDDASAHVRKFLKLYLLKNYDDVRRLSSGGVQPNLNLSHIRDTAVPLPPLAEQKRITVDVDRRFSFVRRLETELHTRLLIIGRLRESILRTMFSGRMRPCRSSATGVASDYA